MPWSWIITIVLALAVARIVYLEVLCGRRSREFLQRTNSEIQKIHERASASYRARYGRDPTGTFPLEDIEES